MAKRVFFSFHYQDVIDFRANVVRNHGSFKLTSQEAGFFDSSMWEEAKKKSDLALKRLINNGLSNTSNTCVLVGTGTYKRPWVRYELLKSYIKGNHILAVHINGIKDKSKKTRYLGKNPLDYVGIYPIDANRIKLIEKKDKWTYYNKIESTDTFIFKNHGLTLNKIYKLSTMYDIYKWNGDNGYNNFSTWLN